MYLVFSAVGSNFYLQRRERLELLWTIGPIIVLLFYALPSLQILYASDDIFYGDTICSISAMQWDWEINYTSLCFSEGFVDGSCSDDYCLINTVVGSHRIMDTVNCIIVSSLVPLVFQLSSFDVIHSFTVPCLGFKLDCIPGKSSEVVVFVYSPGFYYGHCAEICGANHSIMPVEVVAVSKGSLVLRIIVLGAIGVF